MVRAYLPFDAAGKPAGTVSATRSGECWTTSVAATVASAYRCRAGNTILDPCFAVTPRARTVACAADPWSAVEVLHLTSPLPTGEPMGDGTRPWAVQLANGVRCVASTGTVPEVAGFLLDYSCRGGSGVSLADLDQPVVTAHWARAGATAVRPSASSRSGTGEVAAPGSATSQGGTASSSCGNLYRRGGRRAVAPAVRAGRVRRGASAVPVRSTC